MADLTLGWLTLQNATPFEVVDAAGAAGFRSVSLRVTGRKLSDPFPEIVTSPSAIRDIRQRLSAGGLRLSNLSIYHLSPDITLDRLRPAIDAAAALGCPMMVATCADPDHARWSEFMAGFCAATGAAGIRIALEFVPFSEARTLAAGLEILKRTGAANFGLLVDALHLARSGGSPADLRRVDPGRIFFAQLCDAVAQSPGATGLANEARTGRLFPGTGALALHEFLDALPDGVELEIETPVRELAGLPVAEQAKRASSAMRSYLDAHFAARARPNPYS